MYHALTRNHLYCSARVVVCFDDFGNEKSGSGTGFFLKARDGKLYLVSNRHVFDAHYSDERKRNWSLKRVTVTGYRNKSLLPFEFSFEPPTILVPKNENEDVAAFEISDFQVSGELPHDIIWIDEIYLANPESFDEIDISDIVAFPVYHGPSKQPIMRTGWIASDPSQDLGDHGLSGHARRIAVDGFSWSGYSGSPVFTLDRGLKSGAGVTYGGGFRESKMIGINAGHIKVPDRTDTHAGLSYLIKSSVLIELITH